MTAAVRQPICGAIYWSLCLDVYSDIEGDCVCLEPPHDDEVPHLCDAPGCGRQWATLNLGGDAA